MMSETGADVIAGALKAQGVKYMFGVVGRFTLKIANAAQKIGIKYIGTRNEQSACYAASAIGYLTRRPGICLVIPGPGFLNAISGMANAKENCWPMIVLGNSVDVGVEYMGAFQEFPQVEAARPYCKLSARPNSVSKIGFLIEKAFRTSMYGRPGVCYLDIPTNMITEEVQVELSNLPSCSDPPRSAADPSDVSQAAKTLVGAQRPLIIIGKGASYAMAEGSLLKLVDYTGIPFLPTPMGKGVVPDDHLQCVAAARSQALLHADVILLLGARLNWILHFGKPPRFQKDVKFIQVDICAEELGTNVRPEVALLGDLALVVHQLNNELSSRYPDKFEQQNSRLCQVWLSKLQSEAIANANPTEQLINAESFPMTYYQVYGQIREILPRDCFVMTEAGFGSVWVCRTVIPSFLPRKRFDLGTFGTVGAGVGFAVSAALIAQSESKDDGCRQRVVCIQGDSSFGFCGMEVETASRYNLPIVFIIINNNGICFGFDEKSWQKIDDPGTQLPSTALAPNIRYEKIAEAFGCKGYFAETKEQLRDALADAFQETSNKQKPVLINIMIDKTWQSVQE